MFPSAQIPVSLARFNRSRLVSLPTTNVDVHGTGIQVQALANFAKIAGVDVTQSPQTTMVSENTAVGVIRNQTFVPLSAGLTKIAATYNNQSAYVALAVVDTNAWPVLLHRYSFNESSGAVLQDSIGAVHGAIHGPVTLYRP